MSIQTLDQYIASVKQRIQWIKTTSRTSVAAMPESVFDVAGNPGAGTLNVGNTANGLVPTDATAGYPVINAFGGSAVGYLSKVEFGNTVASWFDLFDRLFVAGAYAFNANTTLSAQPSFSGRVPGGTDYKGLQLWVEAVTPFTGNLSIAVTYTNQDGTTGKTTGTVATGIAPILGRCIQLPLAAGDSGISKIESVVATVATAGTFNLMVLRPLWSGRIMLANGGDVHDLLRTGMVQLFADSALYPLITADSTATGIPEMAIEVANA
ncbi:MAG: hypothetical protein PHP88_06665 [bacterium]|nr:hypothetical protein [bacterium]